MKRATDIAMGRSEDFSIDLVKTEDGTFTARSSSFDECYHSTKDGALNESLKKHVEPAFALLPKDKESVTILDICFGLGYNTLATLFYLKREKIFKSVKIVSPEFDEELVKSLPNFPYPGEIHDFKEVIEAVSRYGKYESEFVEIDVIFGDAREFLSRCELTFDIVYQDAFSPKKNPLLWTKEYFESLKKHLSKDAIVTTYSSATPVRMGMYECGLFLYNPPSKGVRSGTIASPSPFLPLEKIDMELKKLRNPAAAPLLDKDHQNR